MYTNPGIVTLPASQISMDRKGKPSARTLCSDNSEVVSETVFFFVSSWAGEALAIGERNDRPGPTSTFEARSLITVLKAWGNLV